MGSTIHFTITTGLIEMYKAILFVGFLHSVQSVCLLNSCSKWWGKSKNDADIKNACAVLFDENCCDTKDTKYVVPKGGKGKLCSTSGSLNPFSSCKGPRLSDDIESLVVMPGCTLEVWDHDDGLEDQEKEERKSFNEGSLKSAKDTYDKNKLTLSAKGTPNWINELDDDFDDLNEDIDSYRCTCN